MPATWQLLAGERQPMMISPAKVSNDLLKQLLHGWKTEDELAVLLQAHPELEPYERVAVAMVSAVDLVVGVIGQQLLDEDDMEWFDISRDAKMNKRILNLVMKPEDVAKIPDLPQEILNNLLAKAEPGEQTLLVLLTIVAGSKFPDFLTEEAYWLLSVAESKFFDRFVVQCRDALMFCLENGVDKNSMLQLIEAGRQAQASGADQAPQRGRLGAEDECPEG